MPEDTDTQPTEIEAPHPAPAFTQADIDRIVKERLERVKAKYADYDDLKTRAARLDEIERAQMDEKERLAADLEALAKERPDYIAMLVARRIDGEARGRRATLCRCGCSSVPGIEERRFAGKPAGRRLTPVT